MKVKIKTLTPIHIGTGKKLGTLEFLDNYRIDYDKFFDMIAEEKQDDFFQWIDQNPQINVQEIINKFRLNKKDIVNKCGVYNFSGSFQRDLNEGIKDSSYKLYIPGSSLKGSLRTALMYKVLSLSSHYQLLNNHLDFLIQQANNFKGNSNRIKSLLKAADDELEEIVFNCGVLKQSNGQTKAVYDDQKYDLLKLVKISDSTSVSTYENGEITKLDVYALKDPKPHPLKIRDRFKVAPIHTESIKDNVELEFDISIDIEFLKRAQKELNDPNSDFGRTYFIGIEQKLKDLFDINIKTDPEFSEQKIVNKLVSDLYKYGAAVSNLEKEWVVSIKNKSNTNVNSLNKLYLDNKKFKIGFGTGFSGMTMLTLLLKNSTLKQKADLFYKAVGIGYHKSTNTPLKIDEFPFTRKYSNKQTIYGGFGWAKFIDGIGNQNNLNFNQRATDNSVKAKTSVNIVVAEIIDDKSKPPKIKILEGEHSEKITNLPGIRLEGFGLSKGSKVNVKLHFDKRNLQKAEYISKLM